MINPRTMAKAAAYADIATQSAKPTLLAVDAGRKLLHLASKPTFANLDAWVNAMLEQE